MEKYDIQAHTENCTGCLRCQLACSDLYSKAFNPSSSRIQVVVSNSGECSIQFTGECNACGICVDHCFYDAVQKIKKEDGQ
jgi:NAD-dependent dihydropyrimidine dehydrogenase PreA subunit